MPPVLRFPRLNPRRALPPAGLALAVVVGPAHATPLLELLGSPRAGESFGAAATARGPSAVYFDPALLAVAPAGGDFSVLVLSPHLTVTRDARPKGYDVPESVYDARLPAAGGGTTRLVDRPLPTGRLPAPESRPDETTVYVMGGAVFRPHERLGLGFHLVLPGSGFQAQNPHFIDEREQFSSNALHFERYGDRLSGVSMGFGAGFRLVDELAVGVGATLLNDAVTQADVYVPDATDQSTALTNAHVEVDSRFAPHFGLAYFPLGSARAPDLTVAATLHLESAGEVDARTRLRFWDYDYPDGRDYLPQRARLVYLSEPLRATLAASGTIAPGLRVAGTARYAAWSAYRDRHGGSSAGFEDVVEGSVDGVFDHGAWRFAVGGLYAPSPAPPQTGRTNVVDNDRVAGRAAAAVTPPVGAGQWTIGLDLTLHRLVHRHQSKSATAADPVRDELPDDAVDVRSGATLAGAAGLQTNNPGFPGFASDGWLWTAALVLAFAWGDATPPKPVPSAP
jgi:long-chain fatty acid transport protein